MTLPAPETIEREKDKLYVTDNELVRRLGVPLRTGKAVLSMLDRDPKSGFPAKQQLWGNRRYWPAVQAYLDKWNGLHIEPAKRRA